MSRWKRVLRGIVGMGVTFGALSAVFFSILAGVSHVFFPGAEDDLVFMVVAGTVWGTGLAVAFSSILALAGRGRSLDELSIPRVMVVGAGAGLTLALLFVGVTWGDWPNGNWIVPLSILPMLGAGGGVASLLMARTAGRALKARRAPRELDAGTDADPRPSLAE